MTHYLITYRNTMTGRDRQQWIAAQSAEQAQEIFIASCASIYKVISVKG